MKTMEATVESSSCEDYVLDEQIGFVLRLAQQRHTTIFASLMIEDLTPTQWAALAKLKEIGPSSQNLLGRLTAMDGATIKGVIDRLTRRGFTSTKPDPADGRRLLVALTGRGDGCFMSEPSRSPRISRSRRWRRLNASERAELLTLLAKVI